MLRWFTINEMSLSLLIFSLPLLPLALVFLTSFSLFLSPTHPLAPCFPLPPPKNMCIKVLHKMKCSSPLLLISPPFLPPLPPVPLHSPFTPPLSSPPPPTCIIKVLRRFTINEMFPRQKWLLIDLIKNKLSNIKYDITKIKYKHNKI